MNLDKYDYEVSVSYLDYEFDSEGPKGVIRKIICFTPVNVSGFFYYNLAFGNLNQIDKTFDDFVLSNNEDAEKILATVASAILDFTNHYPYAVI